MYTLNMTYSTSTQKHYIGLRLNNKPTDMMILTPDELAQFGTAREMKELMIENLEGRN